ncbi:MAG: PAS domain-containing protein [Nitrospirae bacterium]|nr:PAS domain-containing protein [Nitrospirota bacterium]
MLFLSSIWLLTFFISKRVEQEMTAQMEQQQFSTVSYIADSIEGQVKLRLNSLSSVADIITPELIATPGKLREFLRLKPILRTLFQTGVVVILPDGRGIADYPVLPGRTGALFSELEYFKDVMETGRPAVGKPRIGRFSKEPVIGFAVPVKTSSGKIIAVLTGYTLLTDPTLLGSYKNFAQKDFADILTLVSPKHKLIITGTDPTRMLTPTPNTGVNPLFDRFMSGFEGSGVAVNSRGVKLLLSAKQIPTPGWFVRMGLPTDITFAAIRSTKNWAYAIAFGMSLLSSLFAWLLIRQTMRPLYDASTLIEDITDGKTPQQNIPVSQDDEIGQLIRIFNKHFNYRMGVEEKLNQSMSLLNATLESTTDGILVVDNAGAITSFNERFVALWRIPKAIIDTHDDKQALEFVLNQLKDPNQFIDKVKELYANPEASSFDVLEFKDERIFERYSMPQKVDGKTIGRVWSFHNITERKKIEKNLLDSEERFRLAMAGANDGLWDWNLLTNHVYYSPRWKSMLGYAEDELESHIDTWKSVVHPDDMEPTLSLVSDFLEGRAVKYEIEFRLRHKDGQYLNILSRATVVRADDGKPLRLVGTHVDITERKKAEQQITQSLKEKEILLRELYHRTKNNMQVIISLLRLQSINIDDKKTLQILEDTKSRIQAMALVHEKLYKAKNLSRVILGEYIKDLANALMQSHNPDMEQISLHVDVENIGVSIDTITPLGLAINELMINALKYAFPNNRKGEIIIRAGFKEDKIIELTFSDNGIGMPPKVNIEKSESLGLKIVHALIVLQIKGTLEMIVQNGTIFIIRFKDKDILEGI